MAYVRIIIQTWKGLIKMKKIIDIIKTELEEAFERAGYDKEYAKVTLSNRPDLCEYQCNGAMAAAKVYKKNPFVIAGDVVQGVSDTRCLQEAVAVAPGFINLKIREEFVATYLNDMSNENKLGVEQPEKVKTYIMDYGGPNVAKPLHVGHLRSPIIGESLKRITRYMGHKVISDIHLGDWGYQMGLIITELKRRQPDLPYFDESFEGEYPEESPFTISELEEIYPTASAYAKENEAYREEALHATYMLQNGQRGHRAIWEHIIRVSVSDLKENYDKLNVSFDLWKGESDAQPYIPDMVQRFKEEGYARLDDGAWVIDVKKESDTKEIPPCMVVKSDGAALYGTTDLATLVEREKDYHPDELIYIVDKRQELHFEQVFRVAKKTGIVPEETGFQFLGFGTMNGKDGKPFKTRDGGIMRLEYFIKDICDVMYEKILENRTMPEDEARKTADIVGMAAIKYGDLSNQATKDYVFDVDRFTSAEGNTGPYILYTIVRLKSILSKYVEQVGDIKGHFIKAPVSHIEKTLMLEAAKWNSVIEMVYEERAPHKLCAYVFELANTFNRFYHETTILKEENEEQKQSYIALLLLVKDILNTCIELLGFEVPDRM